MSTTGTARPFALIMQTDGGFVLADWTPTTKPADSIDHESAYSAFRMRPLPVHPTVTLWGDDHAAWRGLPVNDSARRLLRLLGAPQFLFCGPVLLTGAMTYSMDGYAEGLTEDQALQLIELYLNCSLHIPTQRTR
ncbi:hypothetical protein [Streptomyces sp. NPDC048269]|uniref:hypothetical protein n=1 Tax=Streptomyces sp. NPDC048269 TaxID=3155753 RepID=UPI003416C2CA